MKASHLPAGRRLSRFVAVIASALAAVTCDLVTGPHADTLLTVEYNGPAVLTVGQIVDFDFRALENSVPIEGARVRVVSSAPGIIEIQGDEFTPRLFVKTRGQATITATLLGSTLGDNPPSVTVSITGVVKAIAIDSASVTFRSLSDTLRLHVEAKDFNDQVISGAGAGARWSSTDAAIAQVDSVSGRITARGNGTAQVIARIDSMTDTTTVLVQQRLARFAFAPVNLVLNALNLDTVVTVIPLDSGGTPLAGGAPAFTTTMTALNAGIASVVRLTNTTFRVTSQGNSGTATGVRVVDAVGNVADDTLSVAVGQIAQTMVITSALSDTIDAFQDTLRVRARAFDSRNVEVQGRAISWTSANTSVATVDQAGLVTGQTAATVEIQAKMDAATAAAGILVRNTPRSVSLSLDSARVTTVGDTIVVGATARNRLGAAVAGVTVTWQSLDSTITKVTAGGAVIATGVGNTRVIATIAGGYADTLRVRVTNDPTSVDIVPLTITLGSVGDTAIPNIDIRNSRGASLGRTTVSWRSADTVVTVSATGVIVARAEGSTFVTATTPDSARADTVLVTVTNAPESVTLNRVLDTLTAPTRTLQYGAVVRNSRSAIISGATVNWHSSNASVASVNAAGLVTALAVGQTLVIGEATRPRASGETAADTARLVVTNDVVSLTVSPTNITVPSVGATATISADPRNAVGASVSGVSVLWTTSDANVAAVDATGTVTGVAVGTATITGSVAGKTASAGVTVTNAPDTISILPATATLASVNDSVTPPVAFRNALGASLPRSSAQWSSLDGAIAQVTPDGIIIATGRGSTLVSAINALNPARRDSITVTVTNAPDSINVGRTLDSLPSLNRTIQYSADVFNARGNLIVGQAVGWTSRTPAVATVSPTGLATSVGIGSTWIVGTAGSRSDSALLVVSNRANSVMLTPASLDLTSIGETAPLTAVARNELGNVIASPTVTWSSANSGVAGVSGTGVVTAVATGSTTVSATVDGVTASAVVTVSNAPAQLAISTPGPLTLASIGDVFTLVADIRNGLNAALPSSAALWTSSDANICTVSGSGVVTATGAGTCTVTATSPANGALASSITVNVTNAPVTLTIAPAGTTTLTAIGAGVTLVATVRNAAGAVIASPSPAVSWSSGSGAVTVNPSTGVATAVSPTAGATITGAAGVATASVTVAVVPGASATRSTITASAASITANGASTATITVQLKDANGNNLTTSGGTVTMTLTGTGTLGPVTNNNNGTYTATLTAPTVLGSGSVSASIGSSTITTGDPLVTYVAGPATKYIVSTSSTVPVAGAAITVSAQLADAFNNPVTVSRTVTWSSTGGGSFGSPTSATNPSGIATVSFTTNTAAGTTHTVTANDGSVGGVSGTIQTMAGAGTNYLVTTSTASAAAGSGVAVTAQLRDVNNNAASQPGLTVTWTKSNANGSFSAPTSTTNSNGAATVTLTTHTVSGTSTTVTATTGGISGTSGTVTTVAGAAATTTTTIASSAGTVNSGLTATITVTARDAYGNALTASGGLVTLTASGGSVSSVTDNNNGTYGATFTAGPAGSITVSGTINGATINSTASITVNVGAVSAAHSVATVPAGTAGSLTTVAIQARDAAGNNLTTDPGVAAQVTISGANPAATATATNNLNGTYTFTYTPTVSGTDAFSITLGGTAILGSPYLSVVGAGGVSTFLVEAAGGGAITQQTAGTGFNIKISARDAGGNVVPSFTGAGNTVVLTSTGTLAGAPVTTGTFTNGVMSSQAVRIRNTGTFTITATRSSGGAQSGTSASFDVVAGAASAAHTTATVPAGQAGQVTTIAVQARDTLDNNRTTSSGTVTVAVSGANTATATVVNNNDGTYTATYTPANTGTDFVTVRLGGTQISGSPYSSAVSVGGLHHFTITNTSNTSIGTQTAGTSFRIRIRARDISNNIVAGFTGTVVLTSSGTLSGAPVTTLDFSGGQLDTAVTITSAGSVTITATNSAGAETGTSNSFTVNPGALDHFLVEESGGGAINTQTAGTQFYIQVTAQDAYDNTVTSFSGSGGGGHKAVITSTGALTGAPITTANFSSGVLASQSVTITNTGSFTLTATRSGGSQTGTSAAFDVVP
jgi:uncharacterized protein YjdB